MPAFGKRRISDKSTGPTTIIAAGCVLDGSLSGDNDFLLSGKVIGNSDLSGVVTITPEGEWSGTLKAGHVVISGTVEGDVIASGSIEITSTARINGTVTGDTIAVAEGAVIQGDMKILGKNAGGRFVEKREDDPAVTPQKIAS